MRRRLSAALLISLAVFFLFASISLHLSRSSISRSDLVTRYPIPSPTSDLIPELQSPPSIHVNVDPISTVAVLLPEWEILVIVSPETLLSAGHHGYVCVFQNNSTSDAKLAGILRSRNRTAFYCLMPPRVKRLRPFLQPALSTRLHQVNTNKHSPELFRWTFLVYESFSTVDEVVLFAKGLNNRPGVNRPPSEFRCVFGDNAVRTVVTSSSQEVFRCQHPDLTALKDAVNATTVSLEIVEKNQVVPSVAYYTSPKRRRIINGSDLIAGPTQPSHELCACTMVYNVAKVLKEWVTYHSRIGVDRFFLYDNDSDDDLGQVVRQLNREGFNITTTFWIWPKTQDAFNFCRINRNSFCTNDMPQILN